MSIADWWSKLSPAARAKLTADPRQPLSPDVVVAITRAAGIGPALTHWEGQAPTLAHLTESESAWIDAHGADSSFDEGAHGRQPS